MKFSFKKSKLLIIALVILIFCILGFFQHKVKNFFYSISSPIQKFLWQKGGETSCFFQGILRSKSLEKELKAAQFKNQELLAEIARLKELKEENEFLRKALDLRLEEDFELILANVISKDPFEDSLIIDAGLRQGVLQGFPVITQQKVLLGRISEAYEDFSRISLISNKEISFSAKIQEIVLGEAEEVKELVLSENQEEETKGIIKGKGSLGLSFELALRGAKIEKGNILVTDILGGIFPEGLLVGEVQEVEKSDIESFQKAKITPFFDLKKLNKVFLIKGSH